MSQKKNVLNITTEREIMIIAVYIFYIHNIHNIQRKLSFSETIPDFAHK